jgi:hypothetical protein
MAARALTPDESRRRHRRQCIGRGSRHRPRSRFADPRHVTGQDRHGARPGRCVHPYHQWRRPEGSEPPRPRHGVSRSRPRTVAGWRWPGCQTGPGASGSRVRPIPQCQTVTPVDFRALGARGGGRRWHDRHLLQIHGSEKPKAFYPCHDHASNAAHYGVRQATLGPCFEHGRDPTRMVVGDLQAGGPGPLSDEAYVRLRALAWRLDRTFRVVLVK